MVRWILGCFLMALIVGLPSPTAAEDERPLVVTFQFQDEDVRQVIGVIGQYAQANVVLHADVQGTVTLSLHAVPWEDALRSVVASVGGAVVEEPGPIYRIQATPPKVAAAAPEVLVQIHDVHDLLEALPDLAEQARKLPYDLDVHLQGRTALVVRASEKHQEGLALFLGQLRREQALGKEVARLEQELRTLQAEVKHLRAGLEALQQPK